MDRDVDLHAGRATRLGVGAQPELVAHDPAHEGDGQHGLERDVERIEVEEEVVGRLHAAAPGVQRMELDAAHVRHEQERGDVVHHQVLDELLRR